MKFRILTIGIAAGFFCFGMVSSIVFQAALMPYLASHAPFERWQFVQDWAARTTIIREVREVVIRVDDAAERVAARADNIVVGVESKSSSHTITGSGFALTTDGFILTLASVVPQGYEQRVYLKHGESFVLAEVLKRDVQQNLAILKSDMKNLQTAEFANPDLPRLASPVVMVAKSLEAGNLITIVNQGSVRAKDQNAIRTNIFDKYALSGSPLFDLEGRIVGISTFDSSGRLVAIPASILRSFSGF